MRRQVRLKGDGLTAARRAILATIEQTDATSISELAAAELAHPSTITPMVDALERLGYLTRSIDPHDRRITRLRLTRKGRMTLSRTRDASTTLLAAELARLTTTERARLTAVIPILHKLLNDGP